MFAGLVPDDVPDVRGNAPAPWWRQVVDADWRHPEGPHSASEGRGDHPVVHVSWLDAQAYCAWSGTCLPTEAEWEYAARGGFDRRRFPWGDDLAPGGQHHMNVFQGTFPGHNSGEDGWIGTCPVTAFQPNGFGLFNMTGNVWEWCSDWFSVTYSMAPRADPQGPVWGERRVMRGGSYLCHDSYSNRCRVAARSSNSPDRCSGNIGFRVVISGN